MPDAVAWTEDLREALLDAARLASPREVVAVLGGDCGADTTSVTAFVEVENVARGDDRFGVDPGAFAAVEQQLRRRGCAFVGFAHSHSRGVAAPSARDRDELWSGCVQLIVAGDDVRAYWFDRARVIHALPLRLEEPVR